VLLEHSGYKKGLRFVGKRTFNHRGYDSKNRTRNVIVCIDALKLPFEQKETQYRPVMIIRELVKSLSGFLSHPGL
jgi:Poly (ADP-ribose) glycohydrolase (PARG)